MVFSFIPPIGSARSSHRCMEYMWVLFNASQSQISEGSILGPKLFSIFVNDLAESITWGVAFVCRWYDYLHPWREHWWYHSNTTIFFDQVHTWCLSNTHSSWIEIQSYVYLHSGTLLAPCLVWDTEIVQLNTRNHVNALVWLLIIGFHGKSTLRTFVTLSARKFQSWNRSSCYQSLSSKKFITQQFFQVFYMVL